MNTDNTNRAHEEQERREGAMAGLKALRRIHALVLVSRQHALRPQWEEILRTCATDALTSFGAEVGAGAPQDPFVVGYFQALAEYLADTMLACQAPDVRNWHPRAETPLLEKTTKSRARTRPASNVIPWPGRGNVPAVSPSAIQ